LKITHLSAFDLTGGAGRSAYRLHTGLRRLGQDSRLLVLEKASSDSSVIQFSPPFDAATRIRRGLKRRFLLRAEFKLSLGSASRGVFSDDRGQHGSDSLRQALPADVLHLHWVSRLIGNRPFFRDIPKDQPLVWTLHDMNPFTGGCHHAKACENYIRQCGGCPELQSSNPNDFSRSIWSRKRNSYQRLDPNFVRIVTPSRWLATHATNSSLLSLFSISVIPPGIDTELFQPRDRPKCRQALNIPEDASVLLFVAQWISDKYKGMEILLAAIEKLKVNPNLWLLVVGQGDEFKSLGVKSVFLGPVQDEQLLVNAYGAADLFVLPSLEDNFPNTALESVACGLPVIGSRVGGIPEIVRDRQTGLLFSRGDAQALATSVEKLLGDSAERRRMSEECRRIAVDEYRLELQSRRYVELYSTLLSPSNRLNMNALGANG
jgi:glycosyltransferase involved in cell wall biosynthesis